ncbi:hypothetical protein [Shewanella nanhaiensis]|uniref:Uncharacterized protein n=1 Tax=Shewanella nanhaiensis TaxID=2864872 RepID=A0ABS7DYK9_9GAMM|nr:hypothetical protein [Shewanella nanhaiensis]MBW8182511.1 hypothetical protein [Shewanella nanhaiensis]
MNINGFSTSLKSETRSVSEGYITPKLDRGSPDKTSAQISSADTVSISRAGKAAQKLDVGSAMVQLKDRGAEATERSESESSSIIDKQIERIKERIEQLKQELKDLQGDKSEVAQKKREMINAEILQLSGMLIKLYEEKAKQEGSE